MGFDPPSNLDVEIVQIDGETLLVFSWSCRRPRRPRIGALTPAEREVLEAVCAGSSNAAIAAARGTAVRTVANQVASLLRKFHVRSRHELVAKLTAA